MTEIVPAPLDGQAALFEDPSRLLQLGDGEWALLVAQAKIATGPTIAQLRRVGGLLAWAGWHRLPERNYSGLITDLADHFGVDDSTIRRWRRQVVAAEHLAVPAVAAAQVAEARARAEKKQKPRSGHVPAHSTRSIEAPNTENPGPRNPERPTPATRERPPAPRGSRVTTREAMPPAVAAHLEEISGWLAASSTADIRSTPLRLRASLIGVMQRWIRELTVDDQARDIADCSHPATRRIGARCALCGGKP